MVIDGHSHVVLPTERQIACMNEAGVDKTVLFSTSIHPELTTSAEEFDKEMSILDEIISGKRNAIDARLKAMDELYSVIQINPSKFIGFGAVPTGLNYEKTCAWIQDNIIPKKFVGLGEFTVPSGQIQGLDAVFSASTEFGNLPLWIHAFFPLALNDIKDIVTLAKKYPYVPVIIGHLGGMNWRDTIKLAKYYSNIYLDLSAFFTTIALKMTIQELPERSIFGVDMPYGDLVTSRLAVERACENTDVREQVLGGTIAELLKL
ncbi:amidohydrolase family protein [Acetivibrio cellulolyticus]|uniref:amidohydrolase family protein n=1 Tax=Acetivibrio cellulolyticus TaxID=35830 RepID=UPI0001E2D075|nr:amidohydrolase family protein [Acetivibrio cellulolyticus]